MKSVVFVDLPTYENMLPLAAGYMQAYAQHDPKISASYRFEIASFPATMDREHILGELLSREADVYAIGCYIWNSKLVQWLLRELTSKRPDAHILLGGPQVMKNARRYLPEPVDNVYVCNGEGELTVHGLLTQLMADRADLSLVPSLSFWEAGELVTTELAPRVKSLTEIPSPFLTGVFAEHEFSFAIMETNRGCPFRCSFCYWGAATNDKVHKFELERIKAELDWITDRGFAGLFIADANWGLAPRDVELSEYLVERKTLTGFPLMVNMAAAKNKPDRMAEITEIFVRGGLMATQPISLQSLSAEALKMVDRQNIRQETYISLQRTLRNKGISSYVELIWPLPGESYASFKEGVTTLCRSDADTLIIYPQLLLNNTPMFARQDEFGLQVESAPSEVAEADVVVATKWVTRRECQDGFWLYYAIHCLYNMRGLLLVSRYLDRQGVVPFGELFASFAEYLKAGDGDICRFFSRSIDNLANYDLMNTGITAHMILSSHREEFDRLLFDFVREQEWWADPVARTAFEMDLLVRPYVYREPFRLPSVGFREVEPEVLDDYAVQVVLPQDLTALATVFEEHGISAPGDGEGVGGMTVRIDHRGRQKVPYMARRSLEHNANYCQGIVLRFREVLPTLSRVGADPNPST
ncbi:radical SAM protein [Kitasatospora sp. NPDC097691]|uniref:B12-binding domain-containing radical SAM protein n=1 Tax=Kitasatospora sp. NPDC097691 TaxID=3157231 RepID=UPI00331A317B